MQIVCVTMRELPSISEQRRLPSPAITPQALAWHSDALWMGSRDLRRVYAIDVKKWMLLEEAEAPGIPWAAVATNGSLCFTLGEGANDDRYVHRYSADTGFSKMSSVPTTPDRI